MEIKEFLNPKVLNLIIPVAKQLKDKTPITGTYATILNLILESNLNKEQMEMIAEFHLEKPENVIKFLINVYFESFNSVYEGISSIRADSLNSVLSQFESVKSQIKYIHCNYDKMNKKAEFEKLHKKLFDISSELRYRINQFISEIRVIDNRSLIMRIFKSSSDLITVDNNVSMLEISFKTYFYSLFFMVLIDTQLSLNKNSYIEEAKEFVYELISKKSISLIYNYDKNHNSQLWSTQVFSSKIKELNELNMNIDKYIEETSTIEVDYNAIDFNK